MHTPQAIVIAGMGFFADAYDLFSISILTKLLGRIYFQDYHPGAKPGQLPINQNAAVTALALVGTLLGQLLFGYLGDRFGRKKVYGVSLALMIFSSIASGMTFGPTSNPSAVIGTLCCFRFFLGMGVGGDYPLSATIMSEYSNKNNRGALVAAVFAMQGIGILAAATVSIVVVSIFKNHNPGTPYGKSVELIKGSCPPEADFVWRIILAFGAVPAALTMYSRMMMPETPRFTLTVQGDVVKATHDVAKVTQTSVDHVEVAPRQRMSTREFVRQWWKPLLGCSVSWFMLDVAFYSQNLFQKDVFTAVGWIPKANTMNCLEETFKIARAQALIALGSTVPGYWFTVFFIDKVGRIPIQIGGFLFMTIFMTVLAAAYNKLYTLTFFFSNFGPNATTFVLPGELFPTAWKATGHGIAAASGKAGAIVGAFGFLYASQPRDRATAKPYPPGIGLRESLGLLAAINFVGMLFTFLIPETKGRTLEEINGEYGDLPLHLLSKAKRAQLRLGTSVTSERTSGGGGGDPQAPPLEAPQPDKAAEPPVQEAQAVREGAPGAEHGG